jgi:hypothetical protein
VSDHDPVKQPTHYTSRVPDIECIQVTQWFNFNLGNVIKYVWRAGSKGDELEDLRKARQYLDFEIARLERRRVHYATGGVLPLVQRWTDRSG